MANETAASEREMLNTLDTRLDSLSTILREDTSHWAPLVRDMALKVIADTRAALPAPADQPPEPQGSSGSLSESGVEARTQDAASASGSLSEIRRTAQVAEAAWWCKNAVRHVRFVSIDAASSIDDRAAAVRAAEEAIDKLAALL